MTSVTGSSRSSASTSRSTSAASTRTSTSSRADRSSARGFSNASSFGSDRVSSVRTGARGSTVRSLQSTLNASGFDAGKVDGKFGAKTNQAVRQFQRAHGLKVDGVVGRDTAKALRGGATTTARTAAPTPSGSGVNGTARLNGARTGPGLHTGTITVNGHTYNFNSGNRSRYATPAGTYRVTSHRQTRSDRGFVRDGVGFSFKIEDAARPGSDQKYDPVAGRQRSNLRIHPDGGAAGTSGCIGIVGDAATLRQFRADMNAELARHGGSYNLTVR